MKKIQNKKTLALLITIVMLWYVPRIVITWLVDKWYENLYWKECPKKDREILPNTELLISACTNPEVRGVPGGEILFVHERKTGEIYLLDLRTGEKKQVPNDPLVLENGIFLSSELVWLRGFGDPNKKDYILDLTSGQRYELVDLQHKFPNGVLENSELNPELYSYFMGVEKIFIHHTYNQLIALAPDFRQHPERNVVFYQGLFGLQSIDAKHGELFEKLMKDLKLDYEIIDFSHNYTEVPSPTGKYVVRYHGVYLSGTDVPLIIYDYEYHGEYLVSDFSKAFRSWYYDESGIVLTQGGYYYQEILFNSHFPLPRPILKLNLSTQ